MESKEQKMNDDIVKDATTNSHDENVKCEERETSFEEDLDDALDQIEGATNTGGVWGRPRRRS